MGFFKPWSKLWPTSILLLVGAITLVVAFKWPLIDTPPPHVDKYYPISTNIPAPWVNENVIFAELWIAECRKYEKDGVEYNMIYAHDDMLGTVFKMDCYGNIEWPHGQEFGAMFLARSLLYGHWP